MKVLSAKLKMQEAFSEKVFFEIIINWLKAAGPCKAVGERLEYCLDRCEAHFEAEYCKADTFLVKKDGITLTLFKLEQVFYEQIWTIEAILKEQGNIKEVFFHVDCSGNTARFDEIPEMRSEVIRVFVNSGYVLQPQIPITENPIYLGNEHLDWIASAVREEYQEEIPLVLATQYFDSMATEIDAPSLAKTLAGIAYVAVCDNEYTRLIKERAVRTAPFNGAIAIYSKGGKAKQFRKEDAYHGASLDKQIVNEIQRFVTAHVDMEAPSWKELKRELAHAEAKESKELLTAVFDVNESLDVKLKKAEERIAWLVQENQQLQAKNESLLAALKTSDTRQTILRKSAIPEFFEGEQHDFVVGILQKALATCGTPDTRQHELLTDILHENSIIGNGKEIFAVVKSVFGDGETLSEKDIADLRKIGFEITSDNTHYKMVFKGSKYWFTVSKTPSDKRGGKNLSADITRRLSVYR